MCFFFFKQKTAYEMRISDWSSDVCSSDLGARLADPRRRTAPRDHAGARQARVQDGIAPRISFARAGATQRQMVRDSRWRFRRGRQGRPGDRKSGVWGKRVSVRVDLGGRRNIKKTNIEKQ